MKIIEYRIYMPLTVEENQIGQLWAFAEISRLNTSGGEGVEILYNGEFDLPLDNDGKIVNKNLPEYIETNSESKASKSKDTRKKEKKKSSSKENKLKKSKNNEFLESFEKSNHNDDLVQEDEEDIEIEDLNIANTKENINCKTGQYTKKNYYMGSKLPWFIRKIVPKDLTVIHERSWNMYPTVKTIVTNEYFKNSFRVQLDTITRLIKNGKAEENVHMLTPEQLEKREIVDINIADEVLPSEYIKDEDPTLFKSLKTQNRGPLGKDWIKTQNVVCCVYKLVCIDFKVFGLQTRVENYLKNMYKPLFTQFHREIFCWSDKWYGLTIEDVRRIEEDLAKTLETQINEGEVSKCALIVDD